ncbi:malonate decarboxylase subunit delta [Paenibacillus antibioticophila]|uniref:malonate decarboxylase subunit delta n=1 Tax=Paenibacillus antibioticophila TaxID=1274374 RepID=UPI0005C8CFE6|nr:malonate decarboxylase subunit delta [Paenibacillus antibioticophila]
MEQLHFQYAASRPITQSAHIGVVGSGDLEILVEPGEGGTAQVKVLTGSEGFGQTWDHVLTRFFTRYPIMAQMTIHDYGATPGVVMLRLTQVLEVLGYAE